MSTRCDNWPEKLTLFVEEKRHQPFDWRENNCCFFACDWLCILTGKDPAKALRARVTSAASAARVLKRAGGVEAIAEAECAKRGWPEVPVAYAQRGDVVLFDDERGQALGVCVGSNAALAGPSCVVFRPMNESRRAWRIG